MPLKVSKMDTLTIDSRKKAGRDGAEAIVKRSQMSVKSSGEESLKQQLHRLGPFSVLQDRRRVASVVENSAGGDMQ